MAVEGVGEGDTTLQEAVAVLATVAAELGYADQAHLTRAFARRYGVSSYHVNGTARMGPAGAPGAVVDAQLRVHGIEALRVVDASIMPSVVGGNTNAPVIMIAEKAADMIKAAQQPA